MFVIELYYCYTVLEQCRLINRKYDCDMEYNKEGRVIYIYIIYIFFYEDSNPSSFFFYYRYITTVLLTNDTARSRQTTC